MNSDKTLQSQLNKPNRQELLNKLHENINKKREDRYIVRPKIMKKLQDEV